VKAPIEENTMIAQEALQQKLGKLKIENENHC
jgi:hypothetical protein